MPASTTGMGTRKSQPLSLRRNFSWTIFANIVSSAARLFILTVLVKLSGAESAGQYALGLALAAPIFDFASLQLRAVQSTDAHQKYEFGDYVSLRLITSVLALLVLCGMVGIRGDGGSTSLVLIAVGTIAFFDAISDVFYGLFQRNEKMDLIAKGQITNAVLSLLCVALILGATGNLPLSLFGSAAISLVILLVYVYPTGLRLLGENAASLSRVSVFPKMNLAVLRNLFLEAAPLGVVILFVSLNNNLPRYFIDHFGGQAQLGYYAGLAALVNAGKTLVSALGQSASAPLANAFAQGKVNRFVRLMRKLVLIGFATGIAGTVVSLVIGDEILHRLYSADYAEYADVLAILAAGACFAFSASFLGYGLTAVRRFREQVPLTLVTVAATGILCWILIPRYGLRGAAIASIGVSLTQFLGAAGILRHAISLTRKEHAA